MILVSKSIYSSLVIQWYIYNNPKITKSQSHTNMCHFDIKSLKSGRCLRVSTRAGEFNSASIIILKSAIMGHFGCIG